MDKTYQRNMTIVAADMNGETVMMDIITGKYYNIGEVGGSIWQLLENPMTLDGLVEKLTAEYAVTPEQCRADVEPFLRKMLACGLINEV